MFSLKRNIGYDIIREKRYDGCCNVDLDINTYFFMNHPGGGAQNTLTVLG